MLGHPMNKSILIPLAMAVSAFVAPGAAEAATASAQVNANISHPVQLTGGGTMARSSAPRAPT